MSTNEKETQHIYVAIMAGGIGSRFWPVSRTNYPKQFLDILGTGKTLIQQTVERFLKLTSINNIYVVTADEYVNITKEQLPNLPLENIVSELALHREGGHRNDGDRVEVVILLQPLGDLEPRNLRQLDV
ncbi:MAG: sugar phosphate nucleotidyltransferase, partial [Chitinophagaceae bacterium]